MNKPTGIVTTVSDERGRKSVLDLIPENRGLFPVGRLDKETEGVLLLTDDGNLAYRLTHPKFDVEKLYQAWVTGQLEGKTIRRLERGVRIGEGAPVRAQVTIVNTLENRSLIRIRIHEGKKRQIRMMMEAVRHRVLYLERIRFAGLTADGLKRGGWRLLRFEEVRQLYKMTGLVPVMKN